MSKETIELTEYTPRRLVQSELSAEAGTLLWHQYGKQVAVEFPSVKTDHQWMFTSQGWVGHIPLTPALHFALHPRIPIQNLFRMLEYVYDLPSFFFLNKLVFGETLQDVFDRLAGELARRIHQRIQQGLYRTYVSLTEPTPFIRGRLHIQNMIQTPWHIEPVCTYDQHTADVEDNRILAWTLHHLVQTGLCTRSLPSVRRALRRLQGTVALTPYQASDCTRRTYNRLNHDYQMLHTFCRFFLDHTGPGWRVASEPKRISEQVPAFLVHMPHLFERFVAAWLHRHKPAPLTLNPQERVPLNTNTYFDIDLVLYEVNSYGLPQRARCVLDTKYKTAPRPASTDIAQVVSYAVAKRCRQAFLVYPTPLAEPFDAQVGDIRVQSIVFDLRQPVEKSGPAFLRDMGV